MSSSAVIRKIVQPPPNPPTDSDARVEQIPPGDPKLERLEVKARAALESCAGRVVSDAEWRRARAKLLEYAKILRSWDQPVKTSRAHTGKVVCIQEGLEKQRRIAEVPCQPEL